ncbi:hypothetical protein ACFU53_00295 [Streptomyces sp. NPDC057474]|uniref:hypothetical protein n=1 Tax=Streptomyces sp. NPDC057474 TaxID=3346144 RepID=UPI0036B132EE
MRGPRRRHHHRTLAGAPAVGLLGTLAAAVPAEADNSAIGYPVYSGSAEPVPAGSPSPPTVSPTASTTPSHAR